MEPLLILGTFLTYFADPNGLSQKPGRGCHCVTTCYLVLDVQLTLVRPDTFDPSRFRPISTASDHLAHFGTNLIESWSHMIPNEDHESLNEDQDS